MIRLRQYLRGLFIRTPDKPALQLVPQALRPDIECIGCRAAIRKMERDHQIGCACQVCGKRVVKNIVRRSHVG